MFGILLKLKKFRFAIKNKDYYAQVISKNFYSCKEISPYREGSPLNWFLSINFFSDCFKKNIPLFLLLFSRPVFWGTSCKWEFPVHLNFSLVTGTIFFVDGNSNRALFEWSHLKKLCYFKPIYHNWGRFHKHNWSWARQFTLYAML